MTLQLPNGQSPIIIPTVSAVQEGTVTPAMLAQFSAGGAPFTPGQALFVSLAWPVGANPLVYFTTIQAALNHAATLTPSATAPIALLIFPGTYTENLTLVSNVNLFGFGRRATQLNGTVTWTPGAGINAPQTAEHEEIDIFYVKMLDTLSMDATGKSGSSAVLDIRDSTLVADWSLVGRSSGTDGLNLYNTLFSPAANGLFTDLNASLVASLIEGEGETVTINGVGSNGLDLYGGQWLVDTTIIAGTGSFLELVGVECLGAFTVANSCNLQANNCLFDDGSAVTVATGGSADLRGSALGTTTLTGPGPIDRTLVQITSGVTASGTNAMTISPPLPNNTYTVAVTQTSAAGGTMPSIAAKTAAGFSLNDAIGTRTFDLTVLKQ